MPKMVLIIMATLIYGCTIHDADRSLYALGYGEFYLGEKVDQDAISERCHDASDCSFHLDDKIKIDIFDGYVSAISTTTNIVQCERDLKKFKQRLKIDARSKCDFSSQFLSNDFEMRVSTIENSNLVEIGVYLTPIV